MKKRIFLLLPMIFCVGWLHAQTTNDLLNLLIENKTISQEKADSLRADFSIRQQASLPDKKIRIDLEMRPRTEYRNGYSQIPNDTTVGTAFVNQRTRLGVNFVWDNRIALQFTLQDARVWGSVDPRSQNGTVNVFEAYAEPTLFPGFSMRIGRQKLIYDNQRLFAENDWRSTGVSHDAVVLKYATSRLTTDLVLAFNQTSERLFGTGYYPSGWTNYKSLGMSFLKFNVTPNWILTSMQTADGYQVTGKDEKINYRFTNGGRLEYTSGSLYLTLAGYYQWGHNKSGQVLDAWYLQPEIKYNVTMLFSIRAGAELFSGGNTQFPTGMDKSFVPLYGVVHRFNGSMDIIGTFPTDLGGAGLVNPYLFLIQTLGKKSELRCDFHLFSNKEDFFKSGKKYDRYLGFENDWTYTYKPNSFTTLMAGVSWADVSETLAFIKKAGTGSASHTPFWSFVSVSFKPQILNYLFK
ncbi:MAG: alginate export family protein [Marinilabiliales bacterium]|nr:alginate export family protein [Marinilabiliales bacterium]